MGREIKRVPQDFNWPLDKVWKGYINPYRSEECHSCEGSGYTKEAKEISDTWYTHLCPDGVKGWGHSITQDEVQALIDKGRLMDFTHDFVKGDGWVRKEPPVVPTAEQVNEWSEGRGFGHDSINHGICVEQRCKRLGIQLLCQTCEGEGQVWFSKKVEELSEGWYDNEKYEPPVGTSFQLWETVSEGSPCSPPFEKPEELADWLVSNPRGIFGNTTKEQWLKFIEKEGWAISMVMDGGKLMNGVEAQS